MSANTTSDDLQRRIAELESKAGQSGSLWDVATAFIPVWLVVATIAGFAGFTGWEYHQKSQQELAKTQRLQFEAAIAEIEARVNTSGEAQKLKAELEAKQEEARQARVEADAKKQEAAGATLREKQVAAELQNKKAKASKTKAEADAMTAKFGNAATLEQQVQWWQFVIKEFEAAKERGGAAMTSNLATTNGMYAAYLESLCRGFRFAKETGCPEQYWPRQAAAAPQARPSAPDAASGPATAVAAARQERLATVHSDTLNLRSCPAPNCDKLLEMPQGYRARVIGDAGNGWAKLRVKTDQGREVEGFANAKHLQF